MWDKLRTIRIRLLETLWFVPALIALGGVALAVGMVEVSAWANPEVLARFPRVFGASADSARTLLSAIGSSIITVAGVTFSLTMVAVAQASSQYTSRILRTFMRDRPTQVVLGTFIAIFAYCLVVLRTVRSVDESPFVPSIAVVVSIVLAMIGMAALLYFIHHIAASLQVSHLLARIGAETLSAIDRLFPDGVADEVSPRDHETTLQDLQGATWHAVNARSTGYLQRIELDRLSKIASRCGLVVKGEVGVGEFVVADTPLALTAPANPPSHNENGAASPNGDGDPDALVASCFGVGTFRTIDQDAAFGIRQIVDVALKALSPGVNDTTTAVTCIDWIGAVLVRLANRSVGSPLRLTNGEVRIIAHRPTFAELVALCIDEIRQSADGNVATLTAMLTMLERVHRVTRHPGRRRVLEHHARLLAAHAQRHVTSGHDRIRLRRLATTITSPRRSADDDPVLAPVFE